MIDKFEDHPSVYYTGDIYRCFSKCKRVSRSHDGRKVDEFMIWLFQNMKGQTAVYQVELLVFKNVINICSVYM